MRDLASVGGGSWLWVGYTHKPYSLIYLTHNGDDTPQNSLCLHLSTWHSNLCSQFYIHFSLLIYRFTPLYTTFLNAHWTLCNE